MGKVDWKDVEKRLNSLLHINTYPLGIRFLGKDEDFPKKTRRPKDFGIKVAVCQAETLSRRWGWAVGLTCDDIGCVPAMLGFGCKSLDGIDPLIDFFMSMSYFETRDAAIKTIERFKTMDMGSWDKMYISPLGRSALDPEVIVIYGDPAQMSRLAQGYIYRYGGVVTSETNLGFSCTNEIIWPLKESRAYLVHPGRGERVVGLCQDHEMAFSMPASQVDGLLAGLEATHRAGTRYPIQSYAMYEAIKLPQFQELENKFKE